LAKRRHSRIVRGHFLVDTDNLPPVFAQTDAQFGFFTGDHFVTEAAGCKDRIKSIHRVAAAGIGIADRCIPFEIAKPIVDAGVGKSFTPSATNDNNV
jgi:hypothetical protein